MCQVRGRLLRRRRNDQGQVRGVPEYRMLGTAGVHAGRVPVRQVHGPLFCDDAAVQHPVGFFGHGPVLFGADGNGGREAADAGRDRHLVDCGHCVAAHEQPAAGGREQLEHQGLGRLESDVYFILFFSLA